jgi:hypothetical protein
VYKKNGKSSLSSLDFIFEMLNNEKKERKCSASKADRCAGGRV